MRKTIKISGIDCRMKSSAAIPRMYRLKFGRDIFMDMSSLKKQMDIQEKMKAELKKQAEEKGEEFDEDSVGSMLPIQSLEMFENIAYLMHKHGDPQQPNDIDRWLEQFEVFDIYKILPEILGMWNLENETKSKPKKKTDRSTGR